MALVNVVIEKAMKKAQGAQVGLRRTESNTVSFENDRLKSVKSARGTGISVKVIVDGKIGSSHTTDINDGDGVVSRALEAAAFGSPAHFRFPEATNGPEVAIYDEAVLPVSKEEMVRLGEEMMESVKAFNSDILLGAGVSKAISHREFANSAGTAFTTKTTSFGVGIHGQWVRGTDILMAGHSFGWKKRDVDHMAVAEKTVNLFRMAENAASVRTADLPVIFTPEGMNVLLLALTMGLNGKNVLLGASPLAGKLGKRIADERFCVTDNPLIDFANGSGQWDAEGVPHQITPLVQDGVVESFLYDLDTAGKAGTKTTGNGVGCGPTNLIIKEGNISYEDMVKNTKEGLIVHEVLGLGQGNVMSGEFSVNLQLAYKIENGLVVGRVKDVMLAGNSYEALKNVVAIGDKAEWGGGNLLTPPIQIAGLSVVAR